MYVLLVYGDGDGDAELGVSELGTLLGTILAITGVGVLDTAAGVLVTTAGIVVTCAAVGVVATINGDVVNVADLVGSTIGVAVTAGLTVVVDVDIVGATVCVPFVPANGLPEPGHISGNVFVDVPLATCTSVPLLQLYRSLS